MEEVLRGSSARVRLVKIDTEGAEVPIYYDPMVAKLVVWGQDRDDAIRRTARALREFRIRGIRTTVSFFRALLVEEDFLEGRYDTGFLSPERMERLSAVDASPEQAIIAAVIDRIGRDFDGEDLDESLGAVAPSRWRWSYGP